MRLLEVQRGVASFWFWAAALLFSLVTHAMAVLLASFVAVPARGRPRPVRTEPPAQLLDITLTNDRDVGRPVPAISDSLRSPAPTSPEGPADLDSVTPASPWPRADVNTPDRLPAAHGGGGDGGRAMWTGRQDEATLRAQPWNDPREYRLGRQRTSLSQASPESLMRSPESGLDAQTRERWRRAGVRDPGSELPRSVDSWAEAEPWPEVGEAGPKSVDSPTGAKARSLAMVGDTATEAVTRGRAEDNLEAAQASDEASPEAFELTRARSGGEGEDGVSSALPGEGISARAVRSGRGEGGTAADVPRELGGHPATHARPQNAYFRRLYDRVFSLVAYPRDLALGLEQGEVIVEVALYADGRLARVHIVRSSGFREFDDALVSAVLRAAPFGRVPEMIRGGRAEVPVRMPFKFDNPLIR